LERFWYETRKFTAIIYSFSNALGIVGSYRIHIIGSYAKCSHWTYMCSYYMVICGVCPMPLPLERRGEFGMIEMDSLDYVMATLTMYALGIIVLMLLHGISLPEIMKTFITICACASCLCGMAGFLTFGAAGCTQQTKTEVTYYANPQR
jgi:hypothetical protein